MEITVDLGGRKRKELAAAVGEIVGEKPVYKGAPSYAYEVGAALIDRAGTLVVGDGTPSEAVRQLLDGLRERGFQPGNAEDVIGEPPERDEDEEHFSLVVHVPLAGFTETSLANLEKLVASKATLLKKVTGTESLSIERQDDCLVFPWFASIATADGFTACRQLVIALCEMAKKQSRVIAEDKPVENEKYAFRCFLLRLGFIGEEYAESRRILLKNLSGNGSMKNGGRKRAAKADHAPDDAANRPENAKTVDAPPPKPHFSWQGLFSGFKKQDK
jgi:hypothetical protein